MFKYKGCIGEKTKAYGGGYIWMITYEDGTHDMCQSLKISIMLCDKVMRRATF